MTITVLDSRNEYVSAASQTVFNFTFKIFIASDLTVYVTPSGQVADDATDLTTDYVVDPGSIGVDAGGFFTFNTPLNAGDKVSVVSEIPYDRTVDYQNNGDFLPETVNGDNDRQVAQIKQILEIVNKTVVFGQSSQNTSGLTIDDPEALKFIRWKPDLSGLENVDVSSIDPDVIANDSLVFGFPTLDSAKASTDTTILKDGVALDLAEHTAGSGGGAKWDVFPSGTFTTGPLIFDVVDHDTLPLQLKLRKNLFQWFPAQFGLISNDATGTIPEDNFNILEYIASILTSYTSLEFPGGTVNLAHSRGYDVAKINGEVALPLQSLKSIWINGNGTKIKVTNHDLAVNNGLVFIGFDAVQTLHVNGFASEMSFINRNNSATYYPFCGFADGIDTLGTVTARTFDQRSSDLHFYGLTFNNFHPEGSFGQALNSFPGDPNNGFKVYGVTVFGDRQATAKEFQNANVTFRDNNFLPTHNGYGFWSWAYNNVTAHNNKSTEYNSWSSDSSGVTTGVSIPMIRYHQWYCSGVNIYDNQFTARNEADRVGSYIGNAIFCNVVNNLAIERQRGETNVHDNTISLRTDDLGIVVNLYGVVNISDNIITGVLLADRPQAGIELSMFEKGKAFVNISGNTSDANFSGPLVRVDNSADVAANRRIKTLNITNNTSLCSFGQVVFFVNTSGGASIGIEKFYASNNIFDFGDSEFSVVNSNGTAIFADIVNEATDVFEFKNNTCLNYYGLDKSGTQAVRSIENTVVGSTGFTSYNYLASIDQIRSYVEFIATEQPRVGLTSNDLFRFSAIRSIVATGVVQQQIVSEVAGGTAIGAGVTPAGEIWRIDQTVIATRRDL